MSMAQKEAARVATITTPSDREIRIERELDAPRERVWRAFTDPTLVAQWWGRGHRLVVERMEVVRGGHWRFVEHGPDGAHGFEGRYREVTPPERIVQTFEWDGSPGHVVLETVTFEALGAERTRVVSVALFYTTEDRDGMLRSGMAKGVNQSYAALDALLAATKEEPAKSSGAPAPAAAAAVRDVAFTMYPVTDIARARRFYEETLGLPVGMAGAQGGKHWVEYDLPGGGCLAITNTTGAQPSADAGGTIALEVQDLTSLMGHLRDEGVTFKTDVIRGPRCQMALCLDSEGNAILLHQLDRAP